MKEQSAALPRSQEYSFLKQAWGPQASERGCRRLWSRVAGRCHSSSGVLCFRLKVGERQEDQLFGCRAQQ